MPISVQDAIQIAHMQGCGTSVASWIIVGALIIFIITLFVWARFKKLEGGNNGIQK